MSDDEPPKAAPNRMLAVGLALAAAACLIYASFTDHWLVNAGQFEEITFGLRAVDQCRGESQIDCHPMSNHAFITELRSTGQVDEASNAFWIDRAGRRHQVVGLLSAAGLVAAAAIALCAQASPVADGTAHDRRAPRHHGLR